MLDDLEGIEAAYSLGIGPNVDWDFEIAERGLTVHQFDHTVEGPPRTHDRFRFNKRKIAATPTEGCETLLSVVEYAKTQRPESGILKIDIENAEWDVFANISPSVLKHFTQILCDFMPLNIFI